MTQVRRSLATCLRLLHPQKGFELGLELPSQPLASFTWPGLPLATVIPVARRWCWGGESSVQDNCLEEGGLEEKEIPGVLLISPSSSEPTSGSSIPQPLHSSGTYCVLKARHTVGLQ